MARALVLEPQVLLFDEPLSNLDAKLRRRVREEIRELQQSLGLTVALRHARPGGGAGGLRPHHRDGQRGASRRQGTPRELYEAPASRFVADFIGDANLVDGEVVRRGDELLFIAAGVALPVSAGGIEPGTATLALRPHRLRLVEPGSATLTGTCKRADYLGSHIEVLANTPWGELLVFGDADAAAPPAAGAPLGLAFEPRDAIVLAR